MNSILAITFAILAVVGAQEIKEYHRQCFRACPDIYFPICASNGNSFKIFPSPCDMEVDNCEMRLRHENVWTKTSNDKCPGQAMSVTAPVKKPCRLGCPRILMPVCAFDGQNYKIFDNECIMTSDDCQFGHNWHKTEMGHCLVRTEQKVGEYCQKVCPYIYFPVCASNGQEVRLFPNECILQNAQCEDSHWQRTRLELCHQKPIVPPKTNLDQELNCPKACTLEYDPVCGFDGEKYVTFGNKCEFNVKNCLTHNKFTLTRMGEC